MTLFTIKLGSQHWRFSPTWFPTLITLIFLIILISLGFWQLQRADYKKHLLQSYQSRLTSAPIVINSLPKDQEQSQYRQVEVKGHYDNDHSILLDNKIYQHQAGYQVLTPFLPLGSQQWVLINRGWVPRPDIPGQLPMIPKTTIELTLTGIIYYPTKQPMLLSPDKSQVKTWPWVSQRIDIDLFNQVLHKPLYPFVILLDPSAPGEFVRNWNPVSVTPYKNIGYALQWFALALALVIIFIVVNTHREKA